MKYIRLSLVLVVVLMLGHSNYRNNQAIKQLDAENTKLVSDVAEARMVATSAIFDSVKLELRNRQLASQVRWLEHLRTP